MVEVRQTEEFSGWLHRLRDANAVARIAGRIRRMEMGNPGDTRGVGHGILEMRIDYGPGYRIYYVHRGAQLVILLCGGDKRTQPKDIKRAEKLAASSGAWGAPFDRGSQGTSQSRHRVRTASQAS